MTKKLLVIAPMADGLIEYFETAEALGYSPISVQTEGPLLDGPWEAILASDVPRVLWRGPVFVGSAVIKSRTAGQRIDRFWRTQFLLAKKVAVEAGATDFPCLIHPTAYVSPGAKLGRGVFIGPGVTVAHLTSLGDFTHVGRGSTVGHHVELGQLVRIGPGVTIPGSVRLADHVTVGPGATFINGIDVGQGAFIGAGSVVTRRVFQDTLVMGNPARRMRNPLKFFRKGVKLLRRVLLRRLGIYSKVRHMYRRFRP